VFARQPEPIATPAADRPLAEVGVFALIEVLGTLLQTRTHREMHEVAADEWGLRQRIEQMVRALHGGDLHEFRALLPTDVSRMSIVVTFLALLELARMRLIKVYQSPGGQLFAKGDFTELEDAMRRVGSIDESYAG
jgi:segregation and condensation protein A